MSEKPLVILAVEGDEELVECPVCEGTEGHNGDDDDWIECSYCGGEGGYWRTRDPNSATGDTNA